MRPLLSAAVVLVDTGAGIRMRLRLGPDVPAARRP
jgi:hypothetical protein